MILLVAHMRQYRGTIAKIKNDFDNSLRYDVFIMKGSKPLCLPDGMNYIFKMFRCRYVMVAVQCPADLDWRKYGRIKICRGVDSPFWKEDGLFIAFCELRRRGGELEAIGVAGLGIGDRLCNGRVLTSPHYFFESRSVLYPSPPGQGIRDRPLKANTGVRSNAAAGVK